MRHSARAAVESSAEIAASVAVTFDRVADTYRWMAERAGSADKADRLLLHSARLKERARRERAEALRLGTQSNASDVD